MQHLKNPKLFKTGFINQTENNNIRLKQGLPIQNLANACISYVNTAKDSYPCNNKNMYPFYYVPYISNPITAIDSSCPCARNVLSP